MGIEVRRVEDRQFPLEVAINGESRKFTEAAAAELNQKLTEATKPSAASAGYRLLTPDDTIGVGDEFLSDDCQTWEEIKGGPTIGEHWMVGKRYNRDFFQPMRRRIRR